MRALGAALLLLAGTFAGCGSLQVRVDVLDPGHVRDAMVEESQRKLYREVVAAEPGEFERRVDRKQADYRRAAGQLVDQMVAAAAALPAGPRALVGAVAQAWRDEVASGQIVRRADALKGDLESRAQQIRELGARLAVDRRQPLPAEVRDLLASLEADDKRLSQLQQADLRDLTANLRGVAPAGSAAAAAIADGGALAPRVDVAAAVARRSILQGGGLAGTEFAYIVARADEGLWAPDFNRAYASGTFGNVDIVIRLNETADFSVKGMMFDASKVAQVASKVLTQSVLIGAQLAGVPLTSASSGTQSGGDALSKSSADLAAAEAVLARREAALRAQRDAMRVAARAILGSAPALAEPALADKRSDDEARKAVHDAVDAALAALKSLIALQDLP
ncbi:MAG: hypothetical protein KF683_11310 [Rubrivivax sp.]|nr:hypothetical protein [Rubrivivax sp.]